MSDSILPDGSPPPSKRLQPGRDGARVGYDSAVREAARALLEGTAMSYRVVAVQVGVPARTVWKWGRAGGWQRPADAPPPKRPGPRRPCRKGVAAEKRRRAAERLAVEAARERPRPPRSRIGAYRADTVGAVRRLLEGSRLSFTEIARRTNVSRTTVGRYARRPGWRRFPDVVATSRPPFQPYPDPIRAEARRLVEESLLPTANIAARVGVHRRTIQSWAKAGGWRSARRDDMDERRPRGGGWRPYQLR